MGKSLELRKRPARRTDASWPSILALLITVGALVGFIFSGRFQVLQPELVNRAAATLVGSTTLYLVLFLVRAWHTGRSPRRAFVWACLLSLLTNLLLIVWFDRVEVAPWRPLRPDRIPARPLRVQLSPPTSAAALRTPVPATRVERTLSEATLKPNRQTPAASVLEALEAPAAPTRVLEVADTPRPDELSPTVAQAGLPTADSRREALPAAVPSTNVEVPAGPSIPEPPVPTRPARPSEVAEQRAEPSWELPAIEAQTNATPVVPSLPVGSRRLDPESRAPTDVAAVQHDSRRPAVPGLSTPAVTLPPAELVGTTQTLPKRGQPAPGKLRPLRPPMVTLETPAAAVPTVVDRSPSASQQVASTMEIQLPGVELPTAAKVMPRTKSREAELVVRSVNLPDRPNDANSPAPTPSLPLQPASPSEQKWQALTDTEWWLVDVHADGPPDEVRDGRDDDEEEEEEELKNRLAPQATELMARLDGTGAVIPIPELQPAAGPPDSPLPTLPRSERPGRRRPDLAFTVRGDVPRMDSHPTVPRLPSLSPTRPAETRAEPSRAVDAPPALEVPQRAPQIQLAGLPHTKLVPDAPLLDPIPQRFLRKTMGAPPTTAVPKVTAPSPAFADRTLRRESAATTSTVVDEKTNVAIEAGLDYLARCQQPNGSWLLQRGPGGVPDNEPVSIESITAATGMSLLAFLGGGYHHLDDKYRTTVSSGLAFLVQQQAPSGDLYIKERELSVGSEWLYSHAIATMALCEAFGMTADETLRAPAQKALDFIVAAQHGELGGWRYAPGVEADTSVTGWMVMALKSGELAGLQVSDVVYQGVDKWLRQAQFSTDQPYLYRYNPFASGAPEQRHGRVPSRAMSAVGLATRLYLGGSPQDANYLRGVEQLRRHPPRLGALKAPLRDAYYWYYATLTMYYAGGRTWDDWNRQLRDVLLPLQIKRGIWAGSWHPQQPVPDRWADFGGRLYVTAMHLLALEVEYRHLPLTHVTEPPTPAPTPRTNARRGSRP